MLPIRIEISYLIPMYYPNMENRVEALAQHGWLIKKANTIFAFYRKQEPSRIRCSVVPFSPPSLMKGISKEERKQFRQLCEDSGWSFVCSTRDCQMYITKDQLVPEIRTDQKEKVKQIQHSMKQVWIGLGLICLFIMILTVRMIEYINVMSLLTNNLLSSFFVVVILVVGKVLFDWRIYRYWSQRNKTWLEEFLVEESFDYSNRFAFCHVLVSLINSTLLLICIGLIVFSMPIGYVASNGIAILLGGVIGKALRNRVDYGGRSEGSNLTLFMVVLFLVIIIVPMISPLINQIEDPLPNVDEVILLTDLSMSHEVDYQEIEPMKSFFTSSQVDYFEAAGSQYVATKRFTFHNTQYLAWYENSLLKHNTLLPFPAPIDLHGGYLNANKKSIYFVDGNSIYEILTSNVLVKASDIELITNKLLKRTP